MDDHLSLPDNEILSALRRTCMNRSSRGHEHADRIMNRKHFKVMYERNSKDIEINPEAPKVVCKAAKQKFGADMVRSDTYFQKGGKPSFPVLKRDDRIIDSLAESQILSTLPLVMIDYVFIAPELRNEAESWLDRNRAEIIALREGREP
jgi:uncharacterized protein